jgi:pSer/pThr/pTyr-binding forkhead associated (FHA) protein
MPVFQLDDQQFHLPAGPVRIGSGAEVDLALPVDAGLGVQAVVEQAGGVALVIRRAVPSALVRVNGVVLGAEPTPLMHGDKVEIGGLELHFADDAKAGATQFVNASELMAMAGARRAGGARATAASGGRLISLVDGKEYHVPDAGVVIGRDASCDIVVGQNEVSRRHAEIAPGDVGYMVRDVSANGVFVNGERVQGSHRLMRADVVRVGSEEFRFYADVLASPSGTPAASDVASASSAPVAPTPPAAEPAPLPAPAPEPVPRVFDSLPTAPSPRQAAPAAERADPRPVLATLEALNEGAAKGSRTPLRTPLAHVGRGAHNDVRLADESVSETHAKLQRRGDGWYLVDMGSTNGSYVGGTRVQGERRLDGTPDLRFGGVKMRFIPAGAASADVEPKGTRAIAAVDRQRVSAVATPQPAAGAPAAGGGIPGWVWIIAAVVVAAAAFFVFKGSA